MVENRVSMTDLFLFQLEKNKFHIQQLEGDVVKCREQVARAEEECRAAQRELKRLQMASNDQRDALANEVSLLTAEKKLNLDVLKWAFVPAICDATSKLKKLG